MTPLSAQDTLQLAQFALDHADDASFWADTDGHLLYVNEAACRTLGHSSQDLRGMSLPEVSPELTPELWSQLWKEIRTRPHFAFELMLRAKDNRVFPVEMTVHRMPLPNQEVLCAFFRDVHEKKRLQQLKNEFVSTVSHELRTPMTIIRESVSQVLDGLLGEVPAPQKEALYITLSGIDRLARIINNLLDVSKMEAGKASLRWERLNLVELIREIIETFAPRAKERGLELASALPSGDMIVYADYDRLVQVFTNLVGNALKFSEKGKIEISVRERDTDVECAVSDTGLGIAREDLERVFNKFEQLSQPAVTGEKGSGLGLSICKGIIEMHQGRIWVESELGKGTSFLFTLPKRTARQIFRQKLTEELAQAAPMGGNVSAVVFEIKPLNKSNPRIEDHLRGWAVRELVETTRTQGARKTDILITDSSAVWLGLINMTKKEAARIMERILTAYRSVLGKNDLKGSVDIIATLCSYPEDVKTEKEFLRRIIGDEDPHVR